jgi:FAD:protein FMN transferase
MNKLNILIVIIIIGLSFFLMFKQNEKMYETNLFYMDTYINIKIFTKDEEQASKALERINEIYKEYHELSDRYMAYHQLNNVYYINNNEDNAETILLDEKLYKLIESGKEWYYISDGIKNINIGNIVDIWKEYKNNGKGVPTYEELINAGSTNIEDIKLLPNNYILNNHPNIDLGSVAKGYATEEVGKYLRSIDITKFLINAGGNVLVGDHYNNGKYKIGIQNPIDGSSIYQVVNGNNIAVVTSGGYERYFTYDGVNYNHIIDPRTLFPANNFKSVTVVTNSSAKADGLSLILFVLSLEDGQEFIKQYDDVSVIWFVDENNIVKSVGFDQYE